MVGLTSPPFALPSAPYTGTTGGSSLVPYTYPISIAGRPFMIDVHQYARRALDKQREFFFQTNTPAEFTFNPEGFWARHQARFSLGAGQALFDADESTRDRFRASKGINPWYDDDKITLHHDTEAKLEESSATKCLTVGGYLYVAVGSSLHHTQDPTVASPTWATEACTDTIDDITTDGEMVYAATSGGIRETALGATSGASLLGSGTNCDLIEFANGRLIGTNGAALFEVNAAGTRTTGFTPQWVGGTWTDLQTSPVGIFAAYTSGGETRFYNFGVDDISTALASPRWVGSLPPGETLNTMIAHQDFLVLGTSEGLRLAPFDTAGRLTIQPAVEILGGVTALELQGRYVWFSWNDYDGTSTGLGRADLSQSIESSGLEPPYASDLMATDQGDVTGICTHSGKRFFVVDGTGLYGEVDDLVASGVFSSGYLRVLTLEDKVFSGVRIGHNPLAGSIAVHLVDRAGVATGVGTSPTAGSLSSDLFNRFTRALEVEVQLTLTRDGSDATSGPEIRHWSVYAVPLPPRVREIFIPIILATEITTLKGTKAHRNPLDDYRFLQNLEESGDVVIYQEMDWSQRGRIDRVFIEQHGEGDTGVEAIQAERYAGDRWFENVTAMVRFLTVEQL